MSKDEAFEKWWAKVHHMDIASCWCWVVEYTAKAAWQAGVEHMRSSTRDLYYKCPGCGEFLAIPIKPHYCNVGLHVSPAPTRADVEAWPIEELREVVAVEVCGATRRTWQGIAGGVERLLDFPDGVTRCTTNFKPDVVPFHNQMLRDAMRAKGHSGIWGDSQGTTRYPAESWARFYYRGHSKKQSQVRLPLGQVKRAITLAALLAVWEL